MIQTKKDHLQVMSPILTKLVAFYFSEDFLLPPIFSAPYASPATASIMDHASMGTIRGSAGGGAGI